MRFGFKGAATVVLTLVLKSRVHTDAIRIHDDDEQSSYMTPMNVEAMQQEQVDIEQEAEPEEVDVQAESARGTNSSWVCQTELTEDSVSRQAHAHVRFQSGPRYARRHYSGGT